MGTGMMDSMTQNAKNSGLDFHFEKAIMANSFNTTFTLG
jgi:protein disulfide-isomerase